MEWVVNILENRGVERDHGPESMFKVETLACNQRLSGEYCSHGYNKTRRKTINRSLSQMITRPHAWSWHIVGTRLIHYLHAGYQLPTENVQVNSRTEILSLDGDSGLIEFFLK